MPNNKNRTKSSNEPEHIVHFDAELDRLEETVDSMMERILNDSGKTRLPVLMRKWEEIHSTVASKIMCKYVQKRYNDRIWKWKKNLSKKQLKRPENKRILFLYQNAKCVHREESCFDADHAKSRSIFDIQLPPRSKPVMNFVEKKKLDDVELNGEKESELQQRNENLNENNHQNTKIKSCREFEHEEEGDIDDAEAEDQQHNHGVEEEGPPRKKVRYSDAEVPASNVANTEENDKESSDWDNDEDEEQFRTRKVKNDFVLTEEELKEEKTWYHSDRWILKFHCSFNGDNESHGVRRWQCLSSLGDLQPDQRGKVVLNETNEKDKHLLRILGIPKKSAEEFLTAIFDCTSCY
jgi:hypothetical protein